MHKAVILVEKEFQDEEYVYPYYRMLEEGWRILVATVSGKDVLGKYGITAFATHSTAQLSAEDSDLVLIPGGWGPERLRIDPHALLFVREMNAMGKPIASICHGAWVLISAGIVKGRTVTGYPGIRDDLEYAGATYPKDPVVRDANIVSAQHYRDNPAFMREVVSYMRTVQPRHYADSHAI